MKTNEFEEIYNGEENSGRFDQTQQLAVWYKIMRTVFFQR